MKKLFFSLLIMGLFTTGIMAQRIAIVDVNDILSSMSAYEAAQAEIDKVAAEWEQSIAQEYDNIKSLYNKYQAEQVLLSDDIRKERENEIVAKEKNVRDLQKRRFGPEGDLFRKRQELVSPIQDQVFAAIEEFAKDKGYDIILDRSSSAGILFTSDDFDKTSEVKRELGIR